MDAMFYDMNISDADFQRLVDFIQKHYGIDLSKKRQLITSRLSHSLKMKGYKDFKSFLEKFTSSAAFQYTRVKFPLKTPVTLLADDGETEKTFPFTKEKWPLLDSETLREERITQEEGGVYVSKFTLNEPAHKVFEAGYEESEVDLRVEFELLPDGKWYVVDCYTGWYGYDLPIAELKQTIQHVQEENAAFKELHP